MKKLRESICVALLGAMLLGACGGVSSESITFDAGTGDKIKVTLDTTEGLELSQENGIISVSKDDESILQGFFIDLEMVAGYLEEIETNESIMVLDQGTQNGVTYVFYSIENEAFTEYDYLMRINDSSTGLIFGSVALEEDAKAGFNAMSFSVE